MKKLYEYDGELLVLCEILAKPECVVSDIVLSNRLKRGVPPKEAATTPARKRIRREHKRQTVDHNPMEKVPCQICPAMKICNMTCTAFEFYSNVDSPKARDRAFNKFESLVKNAEPFASIKWK